MYYKIKEPWCLRGWEKLPYALMNMDTKQTFFLSKEEFHVLRMCNGLVDSDWMLLTTKEQSLLESIVKNGYLEVSDNPQEIASWQAYQKYPARYIRMVHWSITGRCNYRCKHCYMSAPDAKFGELSHEECIRIIDELAECGVGMLSITGGEPLVRKDFWELIDYILEKKILVKVIYSNGALVTDAFLENLKKRGMCPIINMSFDGVGHHDWLRGIPGAEEAVISAFRRCQEQGFPTASELCLHQNNKDTLRESIQLLGSLGVGELKTNPVGDVGNWKEYGENLSLTTEETFDIYLDYLPYYFQDNAPVNLHLGGFFLGEKGKRIFKKAYRRGCGNDSALRQPVCGHARMVAYIAADGRVLPCMAFSGMDIQESFPKVTEIGLKQCLTDSYFMNMISMTLAEFLEKNDECKSCDHRLECGSGCRASAMTTSDNYFGVDRAICALYKGGYKEKLETLMESLGVEIE